MSSRLFRPLLPAVLIPLVAGWLVTLAFAALIARLEYTAVSSVFPPEQIVAEYQARVDHDLRTGPLLWLPQIGVVSGLLTWQIARSTRSAMDERSSLRFGTFAGIVLAIIEGAIAVALQLPMFLVVALIVLLVGVGAFAGWSAGLPLNIQH